MAKDFPENRELKIDVRICAFFFSNILDNISDIF